MKKFSTFPDVRFAGIGASGTAINVTVTSTLFTTVAGSNHTVVLATALNHHIIATLYSGSTSTNKVYFK